MIENELVSVLGSKKTVFFCVGIEIDLRFTVASKLTYFCGGRNWLDFTLGDRNWLDFTVGDRNWLDFTLRDRNWLDFSEGIGSHLFFCLGVGNNAVLIFNVWIENDSVFMSAASKLTWFESGDRNFVDFSVWCEINVSFVGGGRNWHDFCAGIEIDLVFVQGSSFLREGRKCMDRRWLRLVWGSKWTWFLCAGSKRFFF